MTFIVTLSQSQGLVYVDPVTSSRIDFPNASCKDLVGCGTFTHIAVSHSGTFNFRSNCGPLKEGLGSSVSYLTAIGNVNEPVPSALVTAMRTWLASAYSISGTAIVDGTTAPTAAVMTDGLSMQLSGTGFLVDTLKSGGPRIFVSYPIITPVFDICNTLVGFTLAATYDKLLVEPSTCIPYSAVSLSVKMRVSNDPLAYGANTNFGAAATDLNTNVSIDAWSEAVQQAVCGEQLFEAIRTVYNTEWASSSYTLGI